MRTLLIAEIAQAHDGSLGILHSYIDALSATGVDVVKFQMHVAEAESSEHEPFRVPFSRVDKSRRDYWRRMEFTPAQWEEIKAHCESCGMEFLASPFSIAAVEQLEELGVKRYKIASGEITNLLLLERISRTKKPVILSSGMSSWEDLDGAYNFFSSRGIDTSVLQCTTLYPTPAEKLGLNVIDLLRQRYRCTVGFSDHSGNIFACLAARSVGAAILEFHAVFDRRMFGPDATSSLSIDEITQLTSGIRYLDRAFEQPVNKDETEHYAESKKIFGKSLAVRTNLAAGHVLTFDDLESKKPEGFGIPARDFNTVIGKPLRRDLSQHSFLTHEDVHW